ncbi:MAG: aromatic aminobenezylarsenical efflux permease ArsG family transporter [Candidatus Ancaeobacter aquaticus]|nr:aromatic aminobenezylarsenical efflux permease ArsG family transporter [Candidatus Ancaeobacter aquaticus]
MFIIMSALWLGILTSISPCPLATNIAAISFISKNILHPRAVIISGLVYTAGRVLVYAVIGSMIIFSFVSIPAVALFLQKYMSIILGPLLIIVGLILLRVIKFKIPSFSVSLDKQQKIARSGIGGAFLLGALFSLSFCPISAALFFGSLIPLALEYEYGIILPLVYGIGTGLPVVVVAFGIALGTLSVSQWFTVLSKFEYYTKKITGIVFVLAGIYYIARYIISVCAQ